MGRPELDNRIMKQMGSWGNNFNSMEGCDHNSEADKIDKKIDGKDITLNKMNLMDASHAKPSSDNPGVDKSFWAKADPQTDTTGHGKLTRSLKDKG